MAEFDKSYGENELRWHPNACVQLDMEPPKKSSFYGYEPGGPIKPTRSKEEQVRINEVRRELRGLK